MWSFYWQATIFLKCDGHNFGSKLSASICGCEESCIKAESARNRLGVGDFAFGQLWL